jgi:hypothetical protein
MRINLKRLQIAFKQGLISSFLSGANYMRMEMVISAREAALVVNNGLRHKPLRLA